MFWSRPPRRQPEPELILQSTVPDVWAYPVSPVQGPPGYQDPREIQLERQRRQAERERREEDELNRQDVQAGDEAFKAASEGRRRKNINLNNWYLPVWMILLLVYSIISAGLLVGWSGSQLSSVTPIAVNGTGALLCLIAQVLLILTSGWLVYKCHTYFKKFNRMIVDAKNEAEEKKENPTHYSYMQFPMLSRWYIAIWFAAAVAGGVVQGLIASTDKSSVNASIVLASPIVLIVDWVVSALFGTTQSIQEKRDKRLKPKDEEVAAEDDEASLKETPMSERVYGGKVNRIGPKVRRLEGDDLHVVTGYTANRNIGPDLGSDSDEPTPTPQRVTIAPPPKIRRASAKASKRKKSSRRRRRYESDEYSSDSDSDLSFASTVVPTRPRKVQPQVYAQGLARPSKARTRDRR